MKQIEAMQIYLRVAELASFTQAAESLGLPRSTISMAVRQLESELGARLLHRTTRRVQMTQDGQLYYERCRDILADLDELNGFFRNEQTALQGRLRVDMPSSVARDVVLPALPGFLERYPALEIELSSTDRRVDLVREGFDCVLRVGNPGDASYIARRIGHYAMLNCASPAYVESYGMPEHPDELAAHRLIHYVGNFGGRDSGFEYVDPETQAVRHVRMPGALTVNNSEAYLGACLAGLGIVQIPVAGVLSALEQGLLVALMPGYRAEPMPVSIIYANRRHQPRRVQVFMNWLEALMRPRLEASWPVG